MATNFQKLNGEHLGDQDVRSKTYSNPQRTKPTRENYNMNQSYASGGAGLQGGFPTEMENSTDPRNQFHTTIPERFSRSQNQFSPGGRSQHLPNKRPFGKRNPVPDMMTDRPYSTEFRSPSIPSDYSTSEEVQYLTNQVNQLFQEISEIKGFARFISEINYKLDQVMEQNDEVRGMVEELQDSLRNYRTMDGEEDNVQITPEIIQTNQQRGTLQGYSNTLPFTNGSSRDIQNNENSPVRIQKEEGSINRMQDRTNLINSVQVQEKEPLMPDRDDSLETMETKTHENKRQTEYKRDSPSPSVVNETQQGPIPGIENNMKNVGTDMSLQTIGTRQYKCIKTSESDDNRLNYLHEDGEDSETEETPVVKVAPQPRPRSPEEDETEVKGDDDKEVNNSNDSYRKEEVTEVLYEGDLPKLVFKEDQYLEHLALSENNKAKDCLDPKSNGADTIIVIDTSESMAGEPFRKCKEFVNQFVDYVEQWAERYQIEENIAIVRFGHEARIVQHVTNDYNKVRDALDKLETKGPTPMMTGLVVSMSALFNRGGPVTVHDRQVNPRVIVLSDGKATDHRVFEGPDILQRNGLSEDQIKEKLQDFAERVKLENRYFVCIPVGKNPNMDILNPLAEITGGYVSSLDNVKKLSRAFFVEVMISQTRYEGITEEIKDNRHEIESIVRNLHYGKDVTHDEMDEVVAKVIKETEEQIEIEKLREQQREEIDEESDMEAGLRVRRGKDWMWGDQDGFGTGTVIGHRSRGYVRVKWDCGNVGRYRHGAQNAYDLLVVDEPRLLPDDVLIAEGVYVIKGKDWEWQDQDGGEQDAVGCVYYLEDEGIVHVRWENGIRGNYRFGGFGKIDLQILSPRDYDKLKLKRQRRAEQEAENQPYGYATSQNIQTGVLPNIQTDGLPNIQTDGPTSPNIQTDGPLSPNIQTDGPTSPSLRTDRPGSPVVEMDGHTQSSIPVAAPGSNISNVQSEELDRSRQHKSEDLSKEKTESKPDSSAETNESVGVWQYYLNNQWTNFTDGDNERIEKMYSAKKGGTLVIKNNKGENCRILLAKMKHKNTKTGEEIDIKRT